MRSEQGEIEMLIYKFTCRKEEESLMLKRCVSDSERRILKAKIKTLHDISRALTRLKHIKKNVSRETLLEKESQNESRL